ncbi:hypothetical protein NEPAR04_0605 [Nematocida parisii]|nr:hypothetical protein NEPAR03_0254 [Nematocida parisii]KAI5126756.1 hypothetical protein NEPAR08_0608 [Nematocida parisii]KAI5140944.1 hypothetical protein NEPAR04_0605 [Nematocida parisii]
MKKEALRSLLLYEFRCGRTPIEATKNINISQPEQIITCSTVKRWFSKFSTGDISLSDKSRSGRPSKVNLQRLEELVKDNPSATCDVLASQMGISRSTIQKQLRKLGHKKRFFNWKCASIS